MQAHPPVPEPEPELQEGNDQHQEMEGGGDQHQEVERGGDQQQEVEEHRQVVEGEGNEQQEVEGGDRSTEDEDLIATEDEKEHTFSPDLTKEETGPPVPLEQSFLNDTKANLDAIEQTYNNILTLRVDIDNLLKGFKQRLYVDETAMLSMCFKQLRERVGPYETLELNEQDMCIIIGEDADEDAKEAVCKYNLMLDRCREFPEKQREAEKVIKDKISAVETESIQIQAMLVAVERAKKQFDSLHEWDEEIKLIIKGTKVASKHLASRKGITGLQRIIRLED